MEWQKPAQATLWRAIHVYLRVAYDGDAGGADDLPSGTPSAIRTRLQVLRSTDERELYDSSIFERDAGPAPAPGANPVAGQGLLHARPRRYLLRLGNRNYPHMKLVVDRAPDGRGYLFRADTHDNHVRPKPGSRDEKPFLELMEKNRQVAEAIETAWEQEGLPTFKKFLRDDLERRKAAAAAAGVSPPPRDSGNLPA
jgi:hypothetical protein